MKAVVVASGAVDERDGSWLSDADLLLAADGGAASLERLGRRPDVLVGDLDSIEPALAARLAQGGTRVERHAADKEASDTELALESALDAGATDIVLIGALGGGRIDHELANLLLLADPDLGARGVRIARGDAVVRAVHGGGTLAFRGRVGDVVSLLPIGGDARGVTTAGLRWELGAATLRMGRSRGLSNVVRAVPASIRITTGTLLVIETPGTGESS